MRARTGSPSSVRCVQRAARARRADRAWRTASGMPAHRCGPPPKARRWSLRGLWGPWVLGRSGGWAKRKAWTGYRGCALGAKAAGRTAIRGGAASLAASGTGRRCVRAVPQSRKPKPKSERRRPTATRAPHVPGSGLRGRPTAAGGARRGAGQLGCRNGSMLQGVCSSRLRHRREIRPGSRGVPGRVENGPGIRRN